MKFGLVPVNIGAQSAEMMIGLAQKAESVGLESVWTFEHVIVPLEYQSKYPYNEDGKMGVPPEANFIDPLVALTAIACNTKTLRLGTGVNILSQTNPLLLAKQAASLDLISGGRFMLGVGIGWLREEFRAMGVPFERRGARFDDAIEAMKKVWSGEVVEHESEFLSWSGFKSYPVPVQKPHLPVVIGGSKGKAFERIAKYGDGWFVPTTGVEELGALLTQLDEACAREGRDRSTIEISTMFSSEGQGLDDVKRFEDAGVSRLIVPLFSLGGGNPMEGLDKLGNELIAKL
jgi:probable F420-dependent oxidoreductase